MTLAQARLERMMELKMWAVVREIVLYTLFLWTLIVVSYRNRSPDGYIYQNNMRRIFIGDQLQRSTIYRFKNFTRTSFTKVRGL
jgi:polycystin 1L2